MADTNTRDEQLGEMIARARKRAGIRSQEALGKRIGTSKDVIGRLERGETDPTVTEFAAIVRETNAPWLLDALARMAGGVKIVSRLERRHIPHAA